MPKKSTTPKLNIENAVRKLTTLDAKERELKYEERQLRRSQAAGQESAAYYRLLDKIIEVQTKKAKIWNVEIRSKVIPETGKTMWQMAIASKTLPVQLHGRENLLQFSVPDLLAAIKKHKRQMPKCKPTAGITLTAAQKKRLAAKGSITIKRGGKFVTITR